jgi:hypothetical protein
MGGPPTGGRTTGRRVLDPEEERDGERGERAAFKAAAVVQVQSAGHPHWGLE